MPFSPSSRAAAWRRYTSSRLVGPGGFGRTVAIKRLHPHLAEDAEFVSMLLDEARLAGRIQHPNVVGMLDVVTHEDEVLLVMEYVDGESLHKLMRQTKRRSVRIPPSVASAIVVDSLRGLAAAHDAKNERGDPLDIVHRDFTPHNIMVRRDGTSLVVDFGIAKAVGRLHTTEEGKIKGKLPYMGPEQVRGAKLDRRLDIYAAGAVLWETLTGERAVGGVSEAEVLERLLYGTIEPPSKSVVGISPDVDAVVMRALARDVDARFANAHEMGRALEKALPPARPSEVADWIAELVGESLDNRARRVADLERELVDVDSNPRVAMTVIERARPIPEPATPPAARPSVPDPEIAGAPALTTAERPAVKELVIPAAPTSRSRVRGPLVVAAVAILVGTSYALWAAFASKPPATAASSVASGSSVEPAVNASAPRTGPSTSASSALASVPSSPSASSVTSVAPLPVRPPPTAGVVVGPAVKPKHACLPVTIDPKGQKVYHPECMGD